MGALARAYTVTEIEKDLTLVSDLTKECYTCDPFNPRRVPREQCQTCLGTGLQKLAIAEIAAEISKSRLGLSSVPDDEDGDVPDINDVVDDDLNLEY